MRTEKEIRENLRVAQKALKVALKNKWYDNAYGHYEWIKALKWVLEE